MTSHLPGDAVKRLAEIGELRYFDRESPLSRPELLDAVSGATVLVTTILDRVDAAVLDAAGPGLRCVTNVAIGFDNVDTEAAADRGIAVANAPGVLEDATADLALGLLLATDRRIAEGDRLVRSGRPWQWGMSFMLGGDLRGATLGIVGLGGIGRRVAERARAFGMKITYTGRRRSPAAVEESLDARMLRLDELLETVDVVSLHCPFSPQTRHMIDAAALARMRSDAILINTARGGLVDEAALVSALRAGQIRAAGLDVFENEPHVDPGLLQLDNVVLTPHLGSAALGTRERMADLAVDNAIAAGRGEKPPTEIPRPTG